MGNLTHGGAIHRLRFSRCKTRQELHSTQPINKQADTFGEEEM
jgi:hypothetical protein